MDCDDFWLDSPLLYETQKLLRITSEVVVVWVDPDTQKRRLMLRDKCTEDEANAK